MNQQLAAFWSAVVLAAAIVWFDSRVLRDLARTPDRDLRHFHRVAWGLIIVLTFPIGPMLYLGYGKQRH